MQKIKQIISIGIILILGIIGIIFIILSTINELKINININKPKGEEETVIIKSNYIKDYNEYYTVEECVNIFVNALNEQNLLVIDNLINDVYKKENNISIENIYKIISEYNIKNHFFTAEDITYINKNKYYLYYVSGKINFIDHYNYSIDDFSIIITIDKKNETFSIIPRKIKKDLFDIPQSDIKYIQEDIKINKSNKYNEKKFSEEEIARSYFINYLTLLKSDIEKAYSILDKEYVEKRFKNIEEFKEYVEYSKLESREFYTYSKKSYEDYNIYIIEDNFGRNYIFKQNRPNNYTVMLDEYTIELENKFSNLLNNQKIENYINKFIQMINNGDYDLAYNLIDEKFKQKYLKKQEEFEEYINNKMYLNNKLVINKISFNDGYYTANIEVFDRYGEKLIPKEITIIIQVGETIRMSFKME